MEFKYVWLEIATGKFSNSWDEKENELVDQEILDIAKKDGWKLIKYQCLTDDNFEFYNRMIIK